MRMIRWTVVAFAFAVGFIVVADTWAQNRFPGGGGMGGKGFGGGFPRDANGMFDLYSKGRPYIVISESRQMQGPLMTFAKEQGITNDQITREQFHTFYSKMDQYRGGGPFGGGGKGGGPGGFGPPGGSGPPGSPPVAPGQNPLEAIAAWAEADFKRRDLNGDQRLVPEEMPEALRAQIDRWDTDHDGLISLDEYKVYYSARLQMRDGDPRAGNQPSNPLTILIEEDYDRRPDVIRAGKLPKSLPKWFEELDTDHDGQVALHEWHEGGRPINEFKQWDRNDDSFITAEEVLFKQRSEGVSLAGNDNGNGFGPPGGGPFGGPGGPGGFGGNGGEGKGPPRMFGGGAGGDRPGGGPGGNFGQWNRGNDQRDNGDEQRRKGGGPGGFNGGGPGGGMFKKKG